MDHDQICGSTKTSYIAVQWCSIPVYPSIPACMCSTTTFWTSRLAADAFRTIGRLRHLAIMQLSHAQINGPNFDRPRTQRRSSLFTSPLRSAGSEFFSQSKQSRRWRTSGWEGSEPPVYTLGNTSTEFQEQLYASDTERWLVKLYGCHTDFLFCR